MISEHTIYSSQTQKIGNNSDDVEFVLFTEWDEEKEGRTVQISFLDDNEKTISTIYVDAEELKKVCRKLLS